ncbi:CHAT domain-containing protein, partial [Psychrobacter sp. I-STPA10]|uniref:CHAT domain-containing protein n=1 Tax=Psychrobacter sp. I-STPA10 TaxID=2585769 RepID=UPI001E38008A
KSGIALTGATANSYTGKVTALDLMGIQLDGTDMVVLSACDTGKVDPQDSQSISALAKAFIQAGASNVMMSLWSVNDQQTAQMMKYYYQALYSDTKMSQAEALRQAKLKMITEARSGSDKPVYWAAFVLNGAG